MKTLAIFGAGPGAGLATAKRFGAEGFRVALIARNDARLRSFVNALAAEGIEAAPFSVDLADERRHQEVLSAINDRFGQIDVAVVNGFQEPSRIRHVLDVDIDNVRVTLDGALLAPLSLALRLLPAMRQRGDGAVLFGLGASAKVPMPPLGGYGLAGAALRQYVLTAHQPLAAEGVYLGVLTVGALVEGSDAHAQFDASPQARRGLTPPMIAPAELAERYWHLYTKRDRTEEIAGALAMPAATG